MAFDWKALVRAVAPTLGTALGGPVGGMAVQALSTALLGKPDGTEEELAAKMAGATSADLVALKKADQDFAVAMRNADIDLERIAAGDRDSARVRETAAHDSWTPRGLGLIVTIGFFGVLYYIITHGVAQDTSGGAVVLVLLGSLGTAFTQVLNYFFGSTSQSAAKTDMLGKAAAR